MTRWRPLWLVWQREVTDRIRSRAYLISTGVAILVIAGVVFVPQLVGGGPDTLEVGFYGSSSVPIIDAAERLADLDDDVEVSVTEFESVAAGESAISEGDIAALLVDGREVVTLSAGVLSDNTAGFFLQDAAVAVSIQQAVAETGLGAEEIAGLLSGRVLESRSLTSSEAGDPTREVTAYIGLLLMYMAILTYGTWTLSGVTAEKASRVVEVLLATLKPWQLLAGKVAGIGTLALLQFVVVVGFALVAVWAGGVVDLSDVPTDDALMVLFWFVLGFLLYSVMFAAVGSLVSRIEDANAAAMPITIIAVVAFLATTASLSEPSGVVATTATFVPFTAPYVVPVRFALGAVPAWEILVGAAVTAASIAGLVLVAGRVYRGALLSMGVRVKVRDAWRAADG